jgi:hypothetical protein
MATTRKPAAASQDTPAPDAEAMITTVTRVLAHLILSNARGPGTFRQIATQQLNVASGAQVDAIEAWLTAHPGG